MGKTSAVMEPERLRITEGIPDEIRRGETVSDARFDRVYPPWVQKFSDTHWTPIAVARRAAQMLVEDSRSRVLDVGSGCGKFCIVGALSTQGEFYGIEQRRYLVEQAGAATRRWNVPRASFVWGNMEDLDWRPFTGVYLFNPFYEQVTPEIRMDNALHCSTLIYEKYITAVRSRLHLAPAGTRVVTYYGFGEAMPEGYNLAARELFNSGALDLWIKS